MEKGGLKTGQLLGIVEKRGKLIREYVAGFFGDEPIIKQRLLTPQEVRRYREDKERGISEGKTINEAAQAAGQTRQAAGLAGKPRLKRKVAKPGVKVRRRPIGSRGAAPEESVSDAPVRQRPVEGEASVAVRSTPELGYGNHYSSKNDAFIQQLIDNEDDKSNFNPANRQKALTAINRVGSPDMKIYRIGTLENEKEGYFYSQKEYLARDLLGLPLWKPKKDDSETTEKKEDEHSNADNAVAVAESGAEVTTADEAATDAKFDA